MFSDPVIEQYRLNAESGSYSGVFTLAYPSKKACVILGFTSFKPLRLSQLKQLIAHIKATGRDTLIFYRTKHGVEVEKKIRI